MSLQRLKRLQRPEARKPRGRPYADPFDAAMALWSEFEARFILERQRAGIEAAKKKGVYKGRKPSIDRAMVREKKAQASVPRPSPRRSTLAGRRFIGCWNLVIKLAWRRNPVRSAIVRIGTTRW